MPSVIPKLTIELVPSTCFYSNVRSAVSKRDWDKLRKACYSVANYKCVVCGGQGRRWPVECHEEWIYNDQKYIQKLIKLIALCPSCHEVKHIGLADSRGCGEIAKKHLMKINKWNNKKADIYISQAFQLWDIRSDYEWECDLSFLTNKGVKFTSDR